jgi:hypothetical protein
MIIAHTKCTSDSDSILWYFAHKQEAKELFVRLDILSSEAFEEVAWQDIHATLNGLPKMFQLFARKQVFGVSTVLGNLSKQKEFVHLGNKFPHSFSCKEKTGHLLLCRKIGRIQCLNMMLQRIIDWMKLVGTTEEFIDLATKHLCSHGSMLHD